MSDRPSITHTTAAGITLCVLPLERRPVTEAHELLARLGMEAVLNGECDELRIRRKGRLLQFIQTSEGHSEAA